MTLNSSKIDFPAQELYFTWKKRVFPVETSTCYCSQVTLRDTHEIEFTVNFMYGEHQSHMILLT